MTTPTIKITFPDFPSGEINMKVNDASTLTAEVTVDGSVVTTPINYDYKAVAKDGVTPDASIVQVTTTTNSASCNVTGLKIGNAKIKLTVTFTDHGNLLSASSYVTVAVVSTATDELMSMTDAYKLFGWVNAYFSASDSNKITTWPIKETNDIYQVSCTAASHLRLKVSKEIILGDNIAFTVTRGNTFSVTLNSNDTSDQSDREVEGHGVTNIAMIGVASKLELDAFTAHEDDYYSYDKSSLTGTNTGTNYVYIPRLKALNLDYGRISWFRRDRAISIEFMGLDNYQLAPDHGHFANYTEIRQDQIPPTLLNKANNKSFDRGLLPPEENLGLLSGYFRDNGEKDAPGCMAQYHKINLPPDLLADPLLDTGGANILQFMHGKGRLAYDYMDGGMKTFLKTRDSNILMYVGPVVTESVACAAFVKLEYYAFIITNQTMSPWSFNTDVFLVGANVTRSVCRVGCDYNAITQQYAVGNSVQRYLTQIGTGVCSTKLGTYVQNANIFCFEDNVVNFPKEVVKIANGDFSSFYTPKAKLTAGEVTTEAATLAAEGGQVVNT